MLMQRKTCWLAIVGLWVGAPLAYAAPPMIFQHLGAGEGLPQNTVNATLQDSQGFIWIATEDGLVRYDGYETRRYAQERRNPASLPGNYVWAIAEDRGGDLWLAIKNGGLARWNRRTDQFTSFHHDPARTDTSPSSDAIRQVLIDQRGHIWLATTGGGLDDFDPVARTFRHYRHDSGNIDSLSSDVVTALWETPKGELWVGTDDGLNLWLPATRTFRRLRHDPHDPQSLSSNGITVICTDQSGRLLVGTYDAGLDIAAPGSERFTAYRHDPLLAHSLPGDEVRALLAGSDGRVWIGTAAGLALLDSQSGRFDVYAHDPAEPASLPDSYVMSLSRDRSGLVWVGTRAGGVSRWNPRTWYFGHQKPAWIASGYVMSFSEDNRGRLWVGTLGNGAARFDATTGEWTPLERVRTSGAVLADRRVMSMLTDRLGNLWLGTISGGLSRLSPGGELKTWRASAGQPQELPANGVMALYEDSRGRIWIGTFGGGVSILDPATGRFDNVPYDPKNAQSIGSPRVTAIVEDAQGNFWVGTDGGGLNIVRPDGTVAAAFHHQQDNPQSLGANSIYALHRDVAGRIWVGTEGGGLNLVLGSSADTATVHFKTISQAQGLTSDVIYGIRSDDQQRLWLSGNAGLMRYDPGTGEVQQFHREHGLQGEEFNFGAHFRTRDGHLLFGGPNGFNMISASQLDQPAPAPAVVLTGVQIMNRPAALATPYPLLTSLQLGHRDAVVSFDFAVLDYAAPAKTRYAYRLRGFDREFIDLRHGHSVSYTNLDAGKYLLEVKATTGDGVWSSNTLRLPISVTPPPWRTWWAYLAYAALLLLLLWTWYAAQQRKLAQAAQASRRLEAEVALRTHDLEERNVELARLNRTKSSFLARMSHEIRTPMNGVLGTAELLAGTKLSTHQARLAATIRSSAQTLLHILNDILDLAKVEAGKLSLEVLPFDLTALIEETVELLAPQARAKGVAIIVAPAPELRHHLHGDPLRIRQLLTNLLGNAIKFTSHGQIVVAVHVLANAEDSVEFELAVSDTGIGMSAETLAHVFEPFTQADETTTRRFGGTGLGLAICRELVALMNGRITATSEPEVGSTFSVTLQLPRGAAFSEPDAAALNGVTVQIASRRPALVDALARQSRAWGARVAVLDPDRDLERAIGHAADAAPGVQTEVLVVDADSLARGLTGLLAAAPDGCPEQLICICAPDGELRRFFDARLAETQIIATPFPRRALLAALLAGAGRESDAGTSATHAVPALRFAARVLVVEDSAINQMVAEGFLSALGCSVTCVSSGREAIARASSESFNLIFMDLNMPEMDGLTATGLIRKSERDGARVPIVALTANASATHRDLCLEAGCDDFLGKPFTLAALQATLLRWLPAQQAAAIPAAAADAAIPVTAAAAEIAATAAQGSGYAATLDKQALDGLRAFSQAGQTDLLRRLVPVFRRSSEHYLDTIREALPRHDHEAIRACAHALKSSAGNLGAVPLAAAARELEQAGQAGDAQRIAQLAADVFRLHAAAVAALEQEVLRESA
jgi:signal transduction histidine kinase/ligand-binding sensor domain-containing protein/CheY-like chemotaxis protein/HPt (histidine-containing phosphotransfer) domain-containing protein